MAVFIADEVNQLYNVEIAGNGAEAITLLKKHSIQLIISDVMMPVMDGFALLKEVKTEIEFSHIPVILLTAKNTIQSRLEGLELGADAYLDKPFSTNLLMAQISNLISNPRQYTQILFQLSYSEYEIDGLYQSGRKFSGKAERDHQRAYRQSSLRCKYDRRPDAPEPPDLVPENPCHLRPDS